MPSSSGSDAESRGEEAKQPSLGGLSSERERDGVGGWGRLRGCEHKQARAMVPLRGVAGQERMPANYERHQAGVNREVKEKSKLKETPRISTAE